MCGIVGYVGNKKVTDVLSSGLKNLEYRGYDSAGVALATNEGIKLIKAVGKVAELEKKLKLNEIETNRGIAHTRWATHGGVNEDNCHPHKQGKVSLVHNGIIENYKELKKDLIEKGYTFYSETDTEVASALIDYHYQSNNMIDAISKAASEMRGGYALLIFNEDDDLLYAVRKNNPLIVGVGESDNYVASDLAAILEYTNKYVDINEGEVLVVSKDKISKYLDGQEINFEVKVETMTIESVQKGGYEHFMLKEINEQTILGEKLVQKYFSNDTFSDDIIDISKYEYIDIVACGSAYYAGLVGKYFMDQNIANVTVNADVASEYRYKNHFYKENTLVIIISQSGETADTLAALRMSTEAGVDTLAIVNNQLSSIAREAKYVIPMLAGPEIAVATTKGYFTQVIIFNMLILKYLSNNNLISDDELLNVMNELKHSKTMFESLINDIDYKSIAEKLINKDHIYFIGRALDYVVCLEGSLKLKEISYIHSDTYQAGELKHGPIALIEEGTPVISLVTNEELAEKTVSNIIESKSRGANIICFKKDDIDIDESVSECITNIGNALEFNSALTSIIPFQMLAYYVALLKDCDIDKPKNLAKSVTVE